MPTQVTDNLRKRCALGMNTHEALRERTVAGGATRRGAGGWATIDTDAAAVQVGGPCSLYPDITMNSHAGHAKSFGHCSGQAEMVLLADPGASCPAATVL